MSLDLLAPGAADTTVLLGCRVGGLVLVAPVFASRPVPAALKAGLVVLLTLLMAPVAIENIHAAHAALPVLSPASLASETLLGVAVGLGAALLVAAAEAAGDVIAIQAGLSGAAILDPTSEQPSAALATFTRLFAVALLLSLNAHHVMLQALAASTRYVPVGAPVDARAGLGAMLSMGSTLFVLGLRFAAPVIAAVLLANVALAILGRVAPSVQLMAVAFPVQIAVGLFTLAAAIPLIGVWFLGWSSVYDGMLTRVFTAFAGGAR